MASVVERYSADLQSLNRRYDAGDSPEQRQRLQTFATTWRARLADMDFNKLNAEGKADYVRSHESKAHGDRASAAVPG